MLTSVEDIVRDYNSRKQGILKALTSEVKKGKERERERVNEKMALSLSLCLIDSL